MNQRIHQQVQMLQNRVQDAYNQDERGKLSLKHAVEMLSIMKNIATQLPDKEEK
jgi:hypothetical protein